MLLIIREEYKEILLQSYGFDTWKVCTQMSTVRKDVLLLSSGLKGLGLRGG